VALRPFAPLALLLACAACDKRRPAPLATSEATASASPGGALIHRAVKPSATDRAIDGADDAHEVYVASGSRNRKLLVFLPGTTTGSLRTRRSSSRPRRAPATCRSGSITPQGGRGEQLQTRPRLLREDATRDLRRVRHERARRRLACELDQASSRRAPEVPRRTTSQRGLGRVRDRRRASLRIDRLRWTLAGRRARGLHREATRSRAS
jgi:hypothetical protein